MSTVIDFLERMGQDAQLRHANNVQLELALANTAIGTPERATILGGNQRALGELLGAKINLCCMVYPVDGTYQG